MCKKNHKKIIKTHIDELFLIFIAQNQMSKNKRFKALWGFMVCEYKMGFCSKGGLFAI